ncbi:MAG: hypothetical protein ABIA37_03970, partial [Candidatus Woesearchaeota archaeon]
VFFCVESAGKVYDGKGNVKLIRYLFALDFTSAKPLMVTAAGSYDAANNLFEIVFGDVDAAEYKVYFTDYLALEGKNGSAEILKGGVFPGYFWDVKSSAVVDDISKCASGVQKEVNTAYVCSEKVYFTLSDARLGKEFLVGIAAVKDGQEGEIELVKVKSS